MFLKLFLLAIVLNCVVLASCDESKEILTIKETETESKVEENVDLSTVVNSEITVPLNESVGYSESSSESSTATTLNETAISTNVTDDPMEVTTDLNNGYSYDNSTDMATNSTDIDGDKTESSTDDVAEISTETATKNSTLEATEAVTAEETEATMETTVNMTDTSTVNMTEATTATEAITESTATTTAESPTTPIDTFCPQLPETKIDPKYINETFDSHLEEFLRKNPLAKVYKSPGFPEPYAENLNCTLSLTLTNCTGIDVVVHYLDLNPFQPDTLNIRGGEENAVAENGKKLTGRTFEVAFKIIHTTSLYIWFNSGPSTDGYQGFLLTYAPYGNDTLPPTTTEAPIIIPPSRVQVYEVQLVVPERSKTNETWQKFKEVLASSASKYVTDQNLNFDLAHPENVSIDIFNCPNNWPNYKSCVRLQFSIALWSLDYDPEVHFDLSIFDYELSTSSLSVMWDLFGRDDFSEILGIVEYSIPDGTYILLLWTGVSLTIVVIFIGVLYSIWRIDIFREYRRMYTKSDDQQDILKEKSELDISMYPIPHQPYPTLFETNEMNSGGYYDLHEINYLSFQGHSFQQKPSTPTVNRTPSNHFSPNIIDFNDTQLFPDDEEDFSRAQTLSPRSKQKLLVLGAKRDESNT